MPSGSPVTGTAGRVHRADIQALRAVAVTSVLLYHLWPNRLPGGFTGVDVFFVISGFLIAGHMMAEVERTGRLRVGAFWARRARRLLPAALLTLLAVAAATAIWVPRARWEQFYGEVLASTLYVQNWRLARDAVDYLAATNDPSAVQHYWSLSAEEQFYVLLPLLLLGCLLVARVLRRPVRTVAALALVLVTAASFVHAMTLTASSPGVAYFSTFTRVWEFTAGALLALAADRLPRRARTAVVTTGLVLVAGSVLLVDGDLPFPGPWAAVAVTGTVLAIAGGSGTYLDRVGAWRPVAVVGAISFAIYLWHYPLIVIVPFATGHPLTTVDKLLIGVATLVLAWLSTRFVEDPIRFSPRLLGRRRPRTVAVVAVVAMAVVAVSAVVPRSLAERQAERETERAANVLADEPACLGAQARDPQLAPCDNPDLDDTLVPTVAARMDDNPNRADCWSPGGPDGTLRVCDLGPQDAETHLLAIGDSHNNALLSAWEAIAEERGWRISVAGRGWCWWTETDVPARDGEGDACRQWRADARQLVQDHPDVDGIVVTHRRYPATGQDSAPQLQAEPLADGLVRAWADRPSTDVPVIALEDNPMIPDATFDCLDTTPRERLAACDVPRGEALGATSGLREAVERSENAYLVDLTDFFCDARTCPVEIGHVLVYRDPSHLTGTYARTLAPYVADGIEQALRAVARR